MHHHYCIKSLGKADRSEGLSRWPCRWGLGRSLLLQRRRSLLWQQKRSSSFTQTRSRNRRDRFCCNKEIPFVGADSSNKFPKQCLHWWGSHGVAKGPWSVRQSVPACRLPFSIVIYSTWWYLPSKTHSKINILMELLHSVREGRYFYCLDASGALGAWDASWVSPGVPPGVSLGDCLGSRAGVISLYIVKNMFLVAS